MISSRDKRYPTKNVGLTPDIQTEGIEDEKLSSNHQRPINESYIRSSD